MLNAKFAILKNGTHFFLLNNPNHWTSEIKADIIIHKKFTIENIAYVLIMNDISKKYWKIQATQTIQPTIHNIPNIFVNMSKFCSKKLFMVGKNGRDFIDLYISRFSNLET